MIKHFSILDFAEYENMFKDSLNFIKEKIRCDQVLVNLHYDPAKNELNPIMKDLFKNKFNFRLKKVENKDANRIARFMLTVNDKINNLEYMDEPTVNAMNYKINSIIAVCEKLSLKEITAENIDKNVNFFNIMLLICEMLNDHNKFSCNMSLFHQENLREMTSLCTKFLNIYLTDKSKLLGKYYNNETNKEIINKFTEDLAVLHANIDISLKFRNVYTNYRIINEVEVLYYRITVRI